MVKAQIVVDDGRISLSMDGHAGAGNIGNDLVCASASILVYTAAQIAIDMYDCGKLEEHPTIILDSGNASVTLHPKKSYYDYARVAFYAVETGLKLLAHNYPKNVDIETVCSG